MYTSPTSPPRPRVPNISASTVGCSAIQPPYPVPSTTAKASSPGHDPPTSQITKLAARTANEAWNVRTRPTRSASAPIARRPTTLATPITPISAAAATGETPSASAAVGRYTNGTNSATEARNVATYIARNPPLRTTSRSAHGSSPTDGGGRCAAIAATTSSTDPPIPRRTCARRHPYSAIRVAASGAPANVPTPIPATATPTANARCRSNQALTAATIGTYPHATATPTPRPYPR